MAKLSTDELLDAFKEMTLLELSDFVKMFEETFDVTAAAPVAVAAVGQVGDGATVERIVARRAPKGVISTAARCVSGAVIVGLIGQHNRLAAGAVVAVGDVDLRPCGRRDCCGGHPGGDH